ncbi:hypothetical protein [Streptomyces sp. NPDC047000]|uniref:hypothetical protein n=1 Tax=Streptomyces sp. NPDC047000 TaxID=3155474 RepID=UPI0033C62545
MRLSLSLASVSVAVLLVMTLPDEAAPHPRVAAGKPVPDLFGAACRTVVHGSHAVSDCHNPYVDVDRVSLHVECARWWDLDTDAAPVEAGPAQNVRLTGRCWKEVRSAWVTHERVPTGQAAG